MGRLDIEETEEIYATFRKRIPYFKFPRVSLERNEEGFKKKIWVQKKFKGDSLI